MFSWRKVSNIWIVLGKNMLNEVRSTMFQMNPVMPILPPLLDGLWSGRAAIENLDWTRVRVVLNNNLIAISKFDSISWMEKKLFGIEIIVPEPATAAILTIGGIILPLAGRRKNN